MTNIACNRDTSRPLLASFLSPECRAPDRHSRARRRAAAAMDRGEDPDLEVPELQRARNLARHQRRRVPVALLRPRRMEGVAEARGRLVERLAIAPDVERCTAVKIDRAQVVDAVQVV